MPQRENIIWFVTSLTSFFFFGLDFANLVGRTERFEVVSGVREVDAGEELLCELVRRKGSRWLASSTLFFPFLSGIFAGFRYLVHCILQLRKFVVHGDPFEEVESFQSCCSQLVRLPADVGSY